MFIAAGNFFQTLNRGVELDMHRFILGLQGEIKTQLSTSPNWPEWNKSEYRGSAATQIVQMKSAGFDGR